MMNTPSRALATRVKLIGDSLDREARVALLLSVIIGALVGLVVVAFILLTGRLAARMYPPGSSAWRRVLIPVFGSLVSGYLLFRFFPDARGSGIPQTKFALFLRDGYISLRTVVGKFVCCSVSLASGITLGREGPSAQIGAGIASELGRRFGLPKSGIRDLLPVGCSAALAAAFNTPIAAVLFSLEEILGDLHAPLLGSVVISAATSWMMMHLILGDQPLFHVPAYRLVNPVEFLAYGLLGIIGGVVSVVFVKCLLSLRLFFRKLPASTVWLQPSIGGATVGIMALFLPEVLGVGYDYVERVLGGDLALGTVAALAVLKLIATAVCYSSGNAGGIFGPSLFIGAMTGWLVGTGAHQLFPQLTASPGAYALVGMGAAFAGIIRAPLTSVIMIFELTRDYAIIVPLMIANLTSFFLSQLLQKQPIYEALAHQEGVVLSGIERRAAGQPSVANVLRVPEPDELTTVALKPERTVYPDQSLSVALEKMGSAQADTLTVVSRADAHQILGIVTLNDLLAAYGLEAPRV